LELRKKYPDLYSGSPGERRHSFCISRCPLLTYEHPYRENALTKSSDIQIFIQYLGSCNQAQWSLLFVRAKPISTGRR
jgi:hypothetical protein